MMMMTMTMTTTTATTTMLKINNFCVENMFILAFEMGNLYFISDVYEMKTFAVF